VIKKKAQGETCCYFCWEIIEKGQSHKHHLNFPRRDNNGFGQIQVDCHQECQDEFHHFFQINCRWLEEWQRKCGACNPVWALQCAYNNTRFGKIDSEELSLILKERKWWAEEAEKAKEAKKRERVYFQNQAFAAD